MGRKADQASLPKYTGKFSFNSDQLQRYVKAAIKGYDPNDPETWPIVTSTYLEEHLGYKYDGFYILPPNLTYERELVEQCIERWHHEKTAIVGADGEEMLSSNYFLHLPFVFTPRGEAQSSEFMQVSHFNSWVNVVSSGTPEIRAQAGDMTSSSEDVSADIMEMI